MGGHIGWIAQAVSLVIFPLLAGAQPVSFTLCNNVLPAGPQGLVAVALYDRVELVWAEPANRPCKVVYEITAAALPVDDKLQIAVVATLNSTLPRATVTDLQPGQKYTFFVRVRRGGYTGILHVE